MDKKFTFFGILCIVAAILLGIRNYQQQLRYAQYQKDHPDLFPAAAAASTGTATPASKAAPANTAAASSTTPAAPASTTAPAPAPVTPAAATTPATTPTMAGITALTPAATPAPDTKYATRHLSNDYIDVTFTEHGGAIESVALKKFPATINSKDPLVLNAGAPEPALALSVPDPAQANQESYWSWTGRAPEVVAGSAEVPPAPLLGACPIDANLTNNTTITFDGTTPDGVEFIRSYSLSTGTEDPYVIHHTTTIINHSKDPVPLTRLFVGAGMAPVPPPDASYISELYLDFTYFDGSSANYVTVANFMATKKLYGLLGTTPKQRDYVYAAHPTADLQWVSVKDQFFASVLMPKDTRGTGFFVRGDEFHLGSDLSTTVSGDMEFNLGVLPAGAEKKFALDYYAGPKEYVRLDHLGDSQDLIMQFGMFGGFSKILLLALIAIHKFIYPIAPAWSWGWTIFAFTVFIKLITWKLTGIQIRSGRRMQQFQEPLKALREKYKDNPQKLQTEMMEFYKKHKINPFASCLPMLIIFPIFIAFISVMRTSSEMRFQPFFWIHDLSMPDTVGHIGGFAINLLPIIMAITQLLVMHLMPAPSTDAKMQRIMKFMPLAYLGFFYTMPAGMIMYYTLSNFFSLLQQYLTRRSMDEPVVEPATPAKAKSKRR